MARSLENIPIIELRNFILIPCFKRENNLALKQKHETI
jgi:hypothetical protein